MPSIVDFSFWDFLLNPGRTKRRIRIIQCDLRNARGRNDELERRLADNITQVRELKESNDLVRQADSQAGLMKFFDPREYLENSFRVAEEIALEEEPPNGVGRDTRALTNLLKRKTAYATMGLDKANNLLLEGKKDEAAELYQTIINHLEKDSGVALGAHLGLASKGLSQMKMNQLIPKDVQMAEREITRRHLLHIVQNDPSLIHGAYHRKILEDSLALGTESDSYFPEAHFLMASDMLWKLSRDEEEIFPYDEIMAFYQCFTKSAEHDHSFGRHMKIVADQYANEGKLMIADAVYEKLSSIAEMLQSKARSSSNGREKADLYEAAGRMNSNDPHLLYRAARNLQKVAQTRPADVEELLQKSAGIYKEILDKQPNAIPRLEEVRSQMEL